MLAQWLVRFNPTLWRQTEAAKSTQLVAVYGLGIGAGLVTAAVMREVVGAGPPFLWFSLGWLAWSGLVAFGTWRIVRRLDRNARDAVYGNAGNVARRAVGVCADDDESFRHFPAGSTVGIPYRRNRAYNPDVESEIVIPETPEYGFYRDQDGTTR